MLTPEYLKQQPEHIVKIFEGLEDEVIEDISRRIAKNLELTETAGYQIEMLTRMGYDIDGIEKEIAKTTNLATDELEKILYESAETSYNNDRRIYKKGGKGLPSLDENIPMKRFIEATVKQSKGTMRNLSNTIGFADKNLFKPYGIFYRDTIDYAVFQLGTGAFDYNTVLRQAVKKLGDSGLRSIDYESGRRYQLESAVRMNVLTAMSQITGYMSLANADMMGQDLMEITAHMGARPSHKEWQGEIVSREGRRGYLSFEDIGYGDVEGFQGANCIHGWHPFFPGISERAYTDEELENIDPPDFEYGGRSYTAYDATQKQRYYERQMRQTKRNIIAYDGAGLKDDFTAASIKLRRQREEYIKFSKAANLRPKVERTGTYGYNRSISSKSVWAEKKHVVNKYSGYLGTNKYSEVTSKLKEIELSGGKWLLDGFVKAVDKGDVSPLVGVDKYIETARQIEKELVGITTKNDIEIKGYVTHFIDRIIGQHSADDIPRKGMRKGVYVEDVKDALINGEIGEKKIRKDGKPSIVFSNNKCKVTLNPDNKELIQANPYS